MITMWRSSLSRTEEATIGNSIFSVLMLLLKQNETDLPARSATNILKTGRILCSPSLTIFAAFFLKAASVVQLIFVFFRCFIDPAIVLVFSQEQRLEALGLHRRREIKSGLNQGLKSRIADSFKNGPLHRLI